MKRNVPLLPKDELPKQMGRYFVTKRLGVGGMASVYLAELCGPAGFRKKVALKLIALPDYGAREETALRDISTEARLGGLLHHPNIVDVYELGDWQGHRFIAMEWVNGLTLSDLVRVLGPPPAAVVLEIASAIAMALETAHTLPLANSSVGLFHRDIKPSNIMVTRNGEIKLVDFGIAATSSESRPAFRGGHFSVQGTPTYMAPEQFLGHSADARTDLYSLGLVLAFVATGERLPKDLLLQRVLDGKSPEVAVLDAGRLAGINQIAAGFGDLLAKTTDPDANRRFQTAAEWNEAVELLRDEVGFRPRLRTWIRERLQAVEEEMGQDAPLNSGMGTGSKSSTAASADEETVVLFPSNIAGSTDEFVGRVAYLETLKRNVLGRSPVVTLLGMGGTGKTRLAKQCGRTVRTHFPGGAWFIDLTEATDEWSLLQVVSRELDLPVSKQESHSGSEHVAEGLKGLGKALVILDNFEQIAAAASTIVESWCKASPETRFIVTSRIRLKIQGEHVLDLPPLNSDEAIELFYHRALSAGFVAERSLDELNCVTEIVNALDCLPLAIEMAAARTRVLHPGHLLTGLKESRELLSMGEMRLAGKQKSLRSMMEWSWGLLAPWEQSALAQLSVFEGGFSLEAALATVNLSEFWPEAPSLLEVITALYDNSLLHSQATDNNPRFGMYVTVRDFAMAKLAIQEKELPRDQSIHHRHAVFFAGMGEFHTFWGLNYEPGIENLDNARQDLQNSLAGMRWLEKQGDQEAAALACLAACSAIHGDDAVGSKYRLLEHVLGFQLSPDLMMRVVAQIVNVRQAGGHADFEEQVAIMDAALPKEHRWEIPEQELAFRCIRLSALRSPSMAERAQEEFERCEELALRLESPFFRALACLHFGNTQANGANDGSAIELLTRSSDTFLELGAEGYYVLALANLASRQLRSGFLEAAEIGLKKGLKINRRLNRKGIDLQMLCNLGACQFMMGRDEQAEKTFRRVIVLAQKQRDVQTEGSARNNLGTIMTRAGRYEEAIEWLESAKMARVAPSIYDGVADGNIGHLLIEVERFEEAREYLQLAMRQLETKLRWASAVFLGSMALLDALEGDFESAEQRLLDSIDGVGQFDQGELGKLYAKGYLIYRLMHKEAEATGMLEAALKIDGSNPSEHESDIQFILKRSLASRRVREANQGQV